VRIESFVTSVAIAMKFLPVGLHRVRRWLASLAVIQKLREPLREWIDIRRFRVAVGDRAQAGDNGLVSVTRPRSQEKDG
jgi:hypothetical protein